MKKRLVSIIMMSVFACQLVACGAGGAAKAEGVQFEAVAEGQETTAQGQETGSQGQAAETAGNAAEDTQEAAQENDSQAVDFEGHYYAGKGDLSITNMGDGNCLIVVSWGNSAAEHSEWGMSGIYDESAKTITYSDCVKHDITFNENGEVENDVTVYTDGTGNIKIVDGSTIIWTDDKEHIADDVPMTR
ncbi:MAG: hypothetical protein IJU77_07005 [Butyrivibrio sp.]|nr:hypothetical protein [Butyrivibrio sp.]